MYCALFGGGVKSSSPRLCHDGVGAFLLVVDGGGVALVVDDDALLDVGVGARAGVVVLSVDEPVDEGDNEDEEEDHHGVVHLGRES